MTRSGIEVCLVAYDKQLNKLLESWVDTVKRYTSMFEDNPWWYNERATLSTLAGAAWSLDGWIALEEYSTVKKSRSTKTVIDSGALKKGRCDLYISNNDCGFAIEAKQVWQSLDTEDNLIKKGMQLAWDDVARLKENDCRYLAATFIVPFLKLSEASLPPDDLEPRLLSWLKNCSDFRRNPQAQTSYAYLFPDLGSPYFSNRTHHYPGVVLVLEEKNLG